MDDLAAAIVDGVRNPDALLRQVERGREEVLRHYDWDTLADKMESVWRDSVGGGAVELRRAA